MGGFFWFVVPPPTPRKIRWGTDGVVQPALIPEPTNPEVYEERGGRRAAAVALSRRGRGRWMLVLCLDSSKSPTCTPRAEPAGSNHGLEAKQGAARAGGPDARLPVNPWRILGMGKVTEPGALCGTGKVMEHQAGLKAAPGASTGVGAGTALQPHGPGAAERRKMQEEGEGGWGKKKKPKKPQPKLKTQMPALHGDGPRLWQGRTR